MYQDNELIIRPIEEKDLARLWELSYSEESPEWKKWDAPYYEHKRISREVYYSRREEMIGRGDNWVIEVAGEVIGDVSYYWEHEPSYWLEMGIIIYDPAYWGGGYGTRALRMWIRHLFSTLPLVRVGYTTWSGNERMIKTGMKLGMTMEARLRKCRYYDGQFYDSIRMGLLREEWESAAE
ncbi:GNAT family protein [Paenibacillus sp. MMS20-IR301]|uniref:GNAT family N-acetyltransferase n=1 Tax=Paenibacillus sp. MMS20-IR301 TaxID=2895946 RepID=UPI0028E2F04F|nr:GNAT family protein [Paenibacillus sp. MMS20-IR301]WNS44639.1 GNAT family protein [Paenibacillus sp. MMS20-IR301]